MCPTWPLPQAVGRSRGQRGTSSSSEAVRVLPVLVPPRNSLHTRGQSPAGGHRAARVARGQAVRLEERPDSQEPVSPPTAHGQANSPPGLGVFIC